MSTNTIGHEYPCTLCHLPFATKSALRRHEKTTHPCCGLCREHFDSLEHVQSHQKETGHLYCSPCDLSLLQKSQLRRHNADVHPSCHLCRQGFGSLKCLQSHQKETGHLYCSECDLCFKTNRLHIEHVRSVGHITQYLCCDCNRDFNNQKSLDNHCCECDRVFPSSKALARHFKRTPGHGPCMQDQQVRANGNSLHICKKCDEAFHSKKALKKHRLKHKPPRRIPCPVSVLCKKKFITPSGLLDHLESGRCKSGMTRAKMHELVFSHDENHHIADIGTAEVVSSVEHKSSRYCSVSPTIVPTNRISQSSNSGIPSILANPTQDHTIGDELGAKIDDDVASEWSILDAALAETALSDSGSEWSIMGGVPLQPAISETGSEWSLMSPIHTPAASHLPDTDLDRISVTSALQNLRCPRCPPGRKPFCNSVALEAHLASAAHAPRIFHCPLAFALEVSPKGKPKKEKHFATLAALARHLESGACRGGKATFINVMEYVQDQLISLGFESVRLLLD